MLGLSGHSGVYKIYASAMVYKGDQCVNTSRVGNLGELKVIEACLKHGIQVFIPFGDGSVVDMILVVNGRCLRAQVKSSNTGRNGKITFATSSSKSTRTNGERHQYTVDDIDVFIFYSHMYDELYLMDVKEAPKSCVILRHDDPKVKLSTMKFTKDYPFEKIFDYGAMV